MASLKITYYNKEFLNKLALAVPNKDYSLSATLRPDVGEIIRLAERCREGSISSPILSIQEEIDRADLARRQEVYLSSLGLFEEHKIYPFWSLKFDYRSSVEPQLYYEGPHDGETNETYKPSVFLKDKRWFGVNLICDHEGKKVNQIREAVYDFIDKRYVVTSLSIHKGPRLVGEYLEDGGVLFASRGLAEIINEKEGNQLRHLALRIEKS